MSSTCDIFLGDWLALGVLFACFKSEIIFLVHHPWQSHALGEDVLAYLTSVTGLPLVAGHLRNIVYNKLLDHRRAPRRNGDHFCGYFSG